MTHHLDDEAVARLPLGAARAELLEEIMSTTDGTATDPTATDQHPDAAPGTARARGRWVAPLAVAAAVALLVAGPVWWFGGRDDAGSPTPAGPAATPGGDVYGLVLDAEGWEVRYTGTSEGDARSDVAYQQSGRDITNGRRVALDVTWYPAELHDDYVEDREHIDEPPAPGEPVEVLGLTGQSWAYSPDDHTVIAPPRDGWWFEVRVTGVDRGGFLDLLGRLREVDRAGFDAGLPERFVTRAERDDAVAGALQGIDDVADPLLPAGDDGPVTSDASDPYQLGADVAGEVACRWLDAYQAARAAGDDAAVTEAVGVLGTTRDWPVLQEMQAEGDYPEVLWEISDDAVEGRSVAGYAGGLGC